MSSLQMIWLAKHPNPNMQWRDIMIMLVRWDHIKKDIGYHHGHGGVDRRRTVFLCFAILIIV